MGSYSALPADLIMDCLSAPVVYWTMYPFIWLLNNWALWLLKKVGLGEADEHGHTHSEEELRMMIGAAGDGSDKDQFRRDLVLNAFDLKDRIARDVMRPRREIEGLNTESSIEDCWNWPSVLGTRGFHCAQEAISMKRWAWCT